MTLTLYVYTGGTKGNKTGKVYFAIDGSYTNHVISWPMISYVKLFNTILDSSVWCEPDPIRILWITMLAKADRDGIVRASVPGLANHARIEIGDCRKGLAKFLAPDPESTSKEFEGRRIEEVPGGWHLLNHARYRALLSLEERREYNKKKQAEYRAKSRENKKNMTIPEILKDKAKYREQIDREDGTLREEAPPYTVHQNGQQTL